MENKRIVSSSENQAVGAFVDILNRIRAAELLKKCNAALSRKTLADQELRKAEAEIEKLIKSNRGGKTGVHGFIGERIQVSFSNERAIMDGSPIRHQLIDDNGMTDYLRGDTLIQQKACLSDKSLGLKHILSHAEKYPEFLEKSGVYQIPKDFYKKYIRFSKMPESQALKLRKEDLRLWRKVHAFNEAFPDAKIEPMQVTYDEIQADAVGKTISNEAAEVEKKYKKQCESAEKSCRANVKECAKVVAVSAAVEGVMDGGFSLLEHCLNGKKISDFSRDDWKEIGIDTAKGAGKGAIRGAAVYTATNVFHMPASLASAAVSGAFIIAEKTMEYRRGNCDKKGYAFGVIDGCANVAVSALSAEIGKRIIPNPMIGSIVGSLIGGGLYQLTKTIVLRSSSYPSDKERKEQAA